MRDGAAKPKNNQRLFRFIGLHSTGFIEQLSGSPFAFVAARARQAVRWASPFTIYCMRCKVWPVLQHLKRLHKGGLGLKEITGVHGTGGRWDFRGCTGRCGSFDRGKQRAQDLCREGHEEGSR